MKILYWRCYCVYLRKKTEINFDTYSSITMIKLFSTVTTSSVLALGSVIPVTAQVIPDGTTSTTVDVDGTINNGDRAGGNLFHSFSEFSVPTGGQAFFNNSVDIVNIFSRVTGGNISNIDGILGANGSANLFLINPAGIIFGENARLDIGGSFFGSTADSIIFSDGEFSALDTDNPPLLTINTPIGLNFRDNPADIINRSFVTNDAGDFVGLEVRSDNSLALVGGNVNFEAGETTANNGNIELGGLSAAGTVTLNADGTLSFPENVPRADVTLSNASDIDVTGTNGGSVTINARNLSLEGGDFGGSQIRGGIAENSGFDGAQAEDITIIASDTVNVSGNSLIQNQVNTNAVGNAGNINITTSSLTISNGAFLNTSTLGQGNAGNITVEATDSILVESPDPNFGNVLILGIANSTAIGNAGNINLTTGSLTVNDGTTIATAGLSQNSAGDVTINASNAVSFTNGSQIFVFGANKGSLTVNAKSLELISGSIFAAGINIDFGSADAQAGNVIINLTEDLVIDGSGSDALTNISNQNFGTGNAGNIEITARNVTFKNGGNLSSSNNGQGNIGDTIINATSDIVFDGIQGPGRSGIINFVDEEGTGNVGKIEITAQNLSIINGAAVESSVSGNSSIGESNINIENTIIIDGFGEEVQLPSRIASNVAPTGNGNSGDININTKNLILSRNGEVSASMFGLGNAGNININADVITIGQQGNSALSTSGIQSEVLNGSGSLSPENNSIGGDININTGSLSISDGGDVNAGVGFNSFGNGGSITINAADSISIDSTGSIDDIEVASSISSDILEGSFGNSGDIIINTPNLSVSNNAFVSSDISGTGNSGNIRINSNEIFIIDNASVSASIFGGGQGTAGSLTINVTDSVELSSGSFINANVLEGGSGTGGDLFLQAENLTLTGGSQIGASTSGEGNAGFATIQINDTIELIGQSELGRSGLFANATISNGNGGDLNVFTDNLILRDGATISASNFQSLGQSQPGSGNSGDVTINAEAIVAFPNQNNDIIANALQGNGGNINITADAILGIAERPQNPNTNDIDASSQATGLDGTVNVFTPDINSLQSVDRLRVNTVSANIIGTDACSAAGGESNFIIKGKGGVPPKPTAPFPADVLLLDDQAIALEKNPNYISENIKPIQTDKGNIYPARGIVKTADGKIILTAYPNQDTTTRNLEKSLGCS